MTQQEIKKFKNKIIIEEEKIGDNFFNNRPLFLKYKKKYIDIATELSFKEKKSEKYKNIEWRNSGVYSIGGKDELFWSLFDYYIYQFYLFENELIIPLSML